MPVPTNWSDLSQTAASNSPDGAAESRNTADNYLRQVFSYLRKLYDGEMAGQLQFPATQNASSGANVLDDYEEGTFTPTDASGASLTLTSPTGRYVKVGKLVSFVINLAYPATANGSAAVLGGLPFTSANAGHAQGANVSYTSVSALSGALVLNNATTIALYNSSGVALTNANLSGANIYLSGSYEAAA